MGRSVAAPSPAGDGPSTLREAGADGLLRRLRRRPADHAAPRARRRARRPGRSRSPARDQTELEPQGHLGPARHARHLLARLRRPRPSSRPSRCSPTPFSADRHRVDGPGLARPLVAPLARDRHRRLRPRPRVRRAPRPSASRASRCRPRIRLSHLLSELSLLRAEVTLGAARVLRRRCRRRPRAAARRWRSILRFNNLKIAASEQAPRVCQGAMGVCGIVGFKNDTPFSVGRHLRDTMSALPDGRQRAHPPDQREPAADRQGRLTWPSSAPAPPTRRRFLAELLEAGLLIDTGVPGVYGRGRDFEDVRRAVDDARHAAPAEPDDAERAALPAACCRAASSRRAATSTSFPHLAGHGLRLRGRRGARRRAGASAPPRHEDWSEFQTMSDLVLTPGRLLPGLPGDRRARPARRPAASSSTPAAPTSSATSPPATRRGCRCSTCARSSASASPRPSRPGATPGATGRSSCCAGSASTPSFDVAADPFFGRSGRMLAASQRAAGAEVRDPGARSPAPSRPRSPPSTTTRTTSPRPTGSSSPTAASPTPPASASASSGSRSRCCSTHGLDPAAWPAEVREELGLDESPRRPGWSACSASTRRPTSRTRSTAGRAHLHRDQLLRRHPHRAAPRPRRRAAGDRWASLCGWTSRATSGRSSSRRPRTSSALFGLDVHEMQPYRAAAGQIAEQLAAGRTLIVELDAWYLPDTAATSYRTEHVKTSVIAEAIDVEARAAALLPQRRPLRARRRGLPRRLPARPRRLRRRPAALHRARPLRRRPAPRGRGAARGRPGAAARPPRPASRRQPVRALRRRSSRRDLPALLAGDAAALPRLRLRDGPDGRLGVRDRRLARRLAARRRGRPRRAAALQRDRRGLQGALASSSPGAARSTRRRRSTALAAAWDEAIDALDAAVA